jgi:hypothetical protein
MTAVCHTCLTHVINKICDMQVLHVSAMCHDVCYTKNERHAYEFSHVKDENQRGAPTIWECKYTYTYRL